VVLSIGTDYAVEKKETVETKVSMCPRSYSIATTCYLLFSVEHHARILMVEQQNNSHLSGRAGLKPNQCHKGRCKERFYSTMVHIATIM